MRLTTAGQELNDASLDTGEVHSWPPFATSLVGTAAKATAVAEVIAAVSEKLMEIDLHNYMITSNTAKDFPCTSFPQSR